MRQANDLKELDLLVNSGLGVAPVAPALSALLAKIIGADAYGMCWFSPTGVPTGFHQTGGSRQAEELFMNHYEELFVGQYEYTPFWAVRNAGRRVGNALLASTEYFRSNTYNLLIKPNNCHFLLDALVDVDGVPRMTACFFRAATNPFTQADAEKLTRLIPLLRRAVASRSGLMPQPGSNQESGYMLVSSDGQQVQFIDAACERLLGSVKLFDQNVSQANLLLVPPRFVQFLCAQLRAQAEPVAESSLDLAGGSLCLVASWMSPVSANAGDNDSVGIAVNAGSSDRAGQLKLVSAATGLAAQPWQAEPGDRKILVSLQFKPSRAVEVVRAICEMDLSPTQSRIAMFAASGGSRSDCASVHQLSQEALKKHLREIYAASRCANWQELAAALQTASGWT